MAETRQCPKCGAELAPSALEGLCPRCMGRIVFGTSPATLSPQAAAPDVPSPASSAAQPSTLDPQPLVGHYKLLQKIGEGGFGIVYMAEQLEPVQRKVALKLIKAGMDTQEVVARFEAERQALALMDHPNIARVLDAGATDTGRPYFVMELVNGIPITEFCDKAQLSTTERLQLFIKVCHAVQHAHQKGIIHRDIKPSNVLVTLQDGEPLPKVIDFGVAKALGQKLTEKTLFTAFQNLVGTPAYMSPEQAELSGLDVDTRSDIYSLGVLLYELLTGVTPFSKETLDKAALDEVRRIIRETEPPRPSTRLQTLGDKLVEVAKRRNTEPAALSRFVRGDLDWIVMKCLEKERARRYETTNGLATDIECHLNHEPVSAAAPGKLYRAGKFVRRHKVGLAMAAALVLLLLAGTVVSTWQAVRASRAEARDRAARMRAETGAQFLKDMLEGVGPSVALGRDTTLLREILDKTARQVGRNLQDQPDVQAELRRTMGGVYTALEQFAEAEAMHTNALGVQEKLFGRQSLEVAATLNGLMEVLWNQGRLAEAEKAERESLVIRQRLRGPEHLDVANSLNNLAVVLRDEQRHGEAEPMFREALRLERKLLTNDNARVAETLTALSSLLWQTSRLPEAEEMDREALAMFQQLNGAESLEVALALNNLGTVLRTAGKLDDAEPVLRQAMELNEKMLGERHSVAVKAHYNLAGVLWEAGKLPEAESLYRGVLAVWQQPGEARVEVAHTLNNLGTVLRDAGRLAEAEAIHREALAMYRKLSPEHLGIPVSYHNLAYVMQDGGRTNEAELNFREAIERLQRMGDAQRAWLANALNNLAVLLRDTGRLTDAEPLARQALEIRRKVLDTNSPPLALSLETVASLLQRQGKPGEAEPLARECLAIRERRLPNHWRKYHAQAALGAILSQQSKFAEAEPLLREGYNGMAAQHERIPAHAKGHLEHAGQQLIGLYEAWGRLDQAAEWKKKMGSVP